MNKKTSVLKYKKKVLGLRHTARKREAVRTKLAISAKKKEDVRTKLVTTAKQLAVTAKERESIRAKLAITAKEKEEVRTKLVTTAKQLAVTAKEREVDNEKLRTLLDSIGDGVVVIDRKWNITLLNKAASHISGWKEEEAMGKPFRKIIKFVSEQTRKENTSFIEEAMVYEKVTHLDENTILIRKDASEIPVGDSVAPVLDIDKKVVGAIIIFRDLSKERENHRMRSDFAYASHQLRTPVTKAMWNMELILNEKDGDGQIQKSIRDAYLSMKSVQKLVDELLEVSELDQGTIMNVDNKLTNIIEILKDVISSIVPKAKDKDLDISFLPAEKSINTKTNSKFLKRIIFEILDNAINYNRMKGAIKIRIGEQNDGVLIEIEDNGIGITQEQQPLIFTKFFRGGNFDTTAIMGAGLGLYISHEYVKLLKGKIWFKASENKPTIFFILLPKY